MSAKPDGGLRAMVRSELGHIGHWVSLETGATDGGVPDLNVCPRDSGRDVWLECKKTATSKVSFRPAQPGWLYTRYRCGGVAMILTWRQADAGPRKGAARSDLYCTSARYVLELARGGLDEVPHLGRWRGGPEGWDWHRLRWVIENER